jgi:predicted MFS family arabinose efflux permease
MSPGRATRAQPETSALIAGWAVFTLANAQRIAVVPFFNDLRHAFQIDYTAAGGLLSAYLLGYVLAQIPAGLAADNLPTRRVTVAGLLAITIASALFAITRSYPMALLLRGLMGLSAAALYSSTVKLTLGATANRGAAMGVLQSGAGTGMIVGLFAMPLLAQATNLRTAFLAMAAFSCVAFVTAALFLPRGARRQPATEPLGVQVGRIAGQRSFLYLSSCVFLALFSAYGITAWMPTYLRNEFGFTSAAAGAVASLINVALLVVSPFAGTLSDRFGTRAAVVLTGSGVLVCAFALLLAFRGAAWVAVSAVLGGVGLALTLPIITTLTTEVFGIHRAGIAVSLNLAVGQVASTISGVLFGYILDATGSFTRVWTVGLAAAVLGLAPAIALRRMEITPESAVHSGAVRTPGDGPGA